MTNEKFPFLQLKIQRLLDSKIKYQLKKSLIFNKFTINVFMFPTDRFCSLLRHKMTSFFCTYRIMKRTKLVENRKKMYEDRSTFYKHKMV